MVDKTIDIGNTDQNADWLKKLPQHKGEKELGKMLTVVPRSKRIVLKAKRRE